MSTPKTVYQLKVTLDNSKSPIWRRILVPDDITLADLHEIIQRAMGWENYHLHMFTIGGQVFGDPEDDEMGEIGTVNEKRHRLNQLGLREKAKFSYEYDFGDSWDHTILLEKILPGEKGAQYPVCIKGKRTCPPEDVGASGVMMNSSKFWLIPIIKSMIIMWSGAAAISTLMNSTWMR